MLLFNVQEFTQEKLEQLTSEIRMRSGPVAMFHTGDELFLAFHCTSIMLNRLREHYPELECITDSSQKEVIEWFYEKTVEK